MSLAMLAFWVALIALLVWAVQSFSRCAEIKQPPSTAMVILEERLARGEISQCQADHQSLVDRPL